MSTNNAKLTPNTLTPPQIKDPPKKCEYCDCDKDNTIYVSGYGYIIYCSASCFRQTQ